MMVFLEIIFRKMIFFIKNQQTTKANYPAGKDLTRRVLNKSRVGANYLGCMSSENLIDLVESCQHFYHLTVTLRLLVTSAENL